MINRDDLLQMNRGELRATLRAGHPINADDLADREFKGVSLGLPGIVEQLTWKKFTKVFHRDDGRGVLRGWNVRIVQDGLDASWKPMTRRGKPRTFGHFRVRQAGEQKVPDGCSRGLLLDYGAGLNPAFDPISALRDPLVAVNDGSSDLLLGWSYLAVAGTHVPTPSYFSLERGERLTHRVDPPRG